jgi:hypothetical protein
MSESNDKPGLHLSVTIGDFDEEVHQEAVKRLNEHFSVVDNPAYELAEAEVAHAVIALVMATLQAIPAELISSWLYDGLRPLLRSRQTQQTFYEFQIYEHQLYGGTRSVHASLVTDDEKVLKKAMADFKELAQPGQLGREFEFDPETTQKWNERGS